MSDDFKKSPIIPDSKHNEGEAPISLGGITLPYDDLIKTTTALTDLAPHLKELSEACTTLMLTTEGSREGINKYDLSTHTMHKDRKLGHAVPRITKSNQENIGAAFAQSQGEVSVRRLPLLASCIWINMRKPSLEDVSNLAERLLSSRVDYGRDSIGSLFSAVEADLIDDCVDFCLRHVNDSTVATKDLKSVILMSDYPVILMKMAELMHPDNYSYTSLCHNIIEETIESEDGVEETIAKACGHRTEGLIDLKLMSKSAWGRLTEEQKDFMSDRTTKHKVDVVRRVQFGEIDKETGDVLLPPVASNRPYRYKVYSAAGVDTYMTIRNPTLSRFFRDSQVWIRRMLHFSDNHNMQTMSDGERASYLMRQRELTALQQQSHLIYSLENIDEDGNVLEKTSSPEGIMSVIRNYCDRPGFSEAVLDAYEDVVGEMVMTWTGLPITECPSCKKRPKGSEKYDLMPIPVTILFFTLAVFKSSTEIK